MQFLAKDSPFVIHLEFGRGWNSRLVGGYAKGIVGDYMWSMVGCSAFELRDAGRRTGMAVGIIGVVMALVSVVALVRRAVYQVGGHADGIRVVMMRICHGHLHTDANNQ